MQSEIMQNLNTYVRVSPPIEKKQGPFFASFIAAACAAAALPLADVALLRRLLGRSTPAAQCLMYVAAGTDLMVWRLRAMQLLCMKLARARAGREPKKLTWAAQISPVKNDLMANRSTCKRSRAIHIFERLLSIRIFQPLSNGNGRTRSCPEEKGVATVSTRTDRAI
jgi:hypothetical protein